MFLGKFITKRLDDETFRTVLEVKIPFPLVGLGTDDI